MISDYAATGRRQAEPPRRLAFLGQRHHLNAQRCWPPLKSGPLSGCGWQGMAIVTSDAALRERLQEVVGKID